MSDNDSSKDESSTKTDKKAVVFSEKEEMILKVAWRCLKSGPPEIDTEKLMKAGGFNTMKTTTNTWGVIKKKLFADDAGNSLPTAPNTPAKPKAAPKGKKNAPAATPSKKRGKKVDTDDEDDEDEGRTLISKRKKIVKAEASDDN